MDVASQLVCDVHNVGAKLRRHPWRTAPSRVTIVNVGAKMNVRGKLGRYSIMNRRRYARRVLAHSTT